MRDLSAFEQHVNGLDNQGRPTAPHFPDWTYPDGRQPAAPIKRYSKLHSGPTRAERAQEAWYDSHPSLGPVPEPQEIQPSTNATIALAVFVLFIAALFIFAIVALGGV